MSGSSAVRRVDAAAVRPVRHAVLRPHQPVEACVYPLDDVPGTAHFAVGEPDRPHGVASVFPEAGDHDPGPNRWRIRGMAVLPERQGTGDGRRLLGALLDYVREEGGVAVWCNARTNVAGFYGGAGFLQVGEEFDIDPIGPHLLMELRLD